MRVLVLCNDDWHPADTVRHGLAPLNRDWDFVFLENSAEWSAKAMDAFPLVILAKSALASPPKPDLWLTNESAQAFVDFVHRGRGLLVVHSGSSRYDSLPSMKALLGSSFALHPEPCAVTHEPNAQHPISAGTKAFTVRDEHYFMSPLAKDATVFLQSRSEYGLQPAGWTRTEGRGRVCVLTPGHFCEVWLHPEYQQVLANALRWTANTGQ